VSNCASFPSGSAASSEPSTPVRPQWEDRSWTSAGVRSGVTRKSPSASTGFPKGRHTSFATTLFPDLAPSSDRLIGDFRRFIVQTWVSGEFDSETKLFRYIPLLRVGTTLQEDAIACAPVDQIVNL
jgi:hypothetical protein